MYVCIKKLYTWRKKKLLTRLGFRETQTNRNFVINSILNCKISSYEHGGEKKRKRNKQIRFIVFCNVQVFFFFFALEFRRLFILFIYLTVFFFFFVLHLTDRCNWTSDSGTNPSAFYNKHGHTRIYIYMNTI